MTCQECINEKELKRNETISVKKRGGEKIAREECEREQLKELKEKVDAYLKEETERRGSQRIVKEVVDKKAEESPQTYSYGNDSRGLILFMGWLCILLGVGGLIWADDTKLIYVLGIAMGCFFLYGYFQITEPERSERARVRHKQREEEERSALEESIREMKRKREEKQILYQQRQLLRKEIEAMPEYRDLRNAVFTRDGNKCFLKNHNFEWCEKTMHLEMHHLQSFDSILRENSIQHIREAQKCPALWDRKNCVVLCKKCHDLTPSSRWRQYYEKRR